MAYNPKLMVPFEPDGVTPRVRADYRYGTPQDYAEVAAGRHTWRPNVPFRANLTFDHFVHGTSVHVMLEDRSTGINYNMFLNDFETALKAGAMRGDTLTGEFAYVKKGRYFGLICLGPQDRTES